MCSTTGIATSAGEKRLPALTFEQVERLTSVLSEPVSIIPKAGNFPVLNISPLQLVKVVQGRLQDKKIDVFDIRLNGSAASYCLTEEREKAPKPHYNDLDMIFRVGLRSDYDLDIIKTEVLNSLFEFFPNNAMTDRISCYMLEESYVKKMVKVSRCSNDHWSLISLGDDMGKNIELKFVDSMKRQYEFSIDSFQIILDSYLSFQEAKLEASPVEVKPDFYPCVYVSSLYGEYDKALDHLNKRLISTKNPEEIRGGGLLKYCCLLVSGYQTAEPTVMDAQERYMCNRFFIDFPTTCAAYHAKINKYIYSRFLQAGNVPKAIEFLDTLARIIRSCALLCLSEGEKQKTLSSIQQIQFSISWGSPYCQFVYVHPSQHHQQQQWYGGHHHRSTHYSNHTHKYRSCNTGSKDRDSPSTSPPPFSFPHLTNNTVPIGPTPTQVR